MHILVTGGNGLVGRNIREHWRASNHTISAPCRSELNLLDAVAVNDYVSRIQPDILVHAAGRVGGIQANMTAPVDFLVDNWEMGKNIILAAREAGISRLLNIGSSCMYPKGYLQPLTEDMILSGKLEPTNEGYALAKIACQRLCDYVSRDRSYHYKTIIPCNIYGRHDSFSPEKSHLIPAIIYKLHNAIKSGTQTVEIWGDGRARREFMYADDLADCIYECIERFEEMPSLMNIGCGIDYTIDEYYHRVANVVGYEGGFTHDLGKPTGMARKIVCVNRLEKWGWSAKVPLETGIIYTYEFFRSLQK